MRRIQGLIEAAVPKKVSLEFDLGKHLPRIDADANQVQQVVLNLVSNAAEAIGEETGVIAIRTGSDTGGHRLPRGAGHRLRHGRGDAEQDLRSVLHDEIHRPRTRVWRRWRESCAGTSADMRVSSAPGKGSTFRVSFPSAESRPRRRSCRSPGEVAGDTVLVVDDEEMVRRIAQASLEIRGYTVVMAR